MGLEPTTFTLATGGPDEPKPLKNQVLTHQPASTLTNYSQNRRHADADAELCSVIDAWPGLTPAERQTVLDIISTPRPAVKGQLELDYADISDPQA